MSSDSSSSDIDLTDPAASDAQHPAPRDMPAPKGSMPVRQLTVLGLTSALVVASKWILHIPMKIPGHTGVLWIAAMFIGRSAVRRNGAATIIGIVSGTLLAASLPGREGLLTVVKYVAAGVMMDLAAWFFGEKFDKPVYAAVAGAIAHTAKLVSSLLVGMMMGIPAGFLFLGIGFASTTHVFFGALGGLLGVWTVTMLRAAPIPAVRAFFDKEARG